MHDRLRAHVQTEEAQRQAATSPHAEYLAFKKWLQNDIGLTYQIQPGAIIQWGGPNGGTSPGQFLLSPNADWVMFHNDSIGEGSLQFSYTYNKYWSRPTGASMSNRLNVLSQINDSATNTYNFSTLTYTHVFPGNVFQISVGQFGFGNFDGNQYAGNQLTNFVNYALAQNGSQAYVPDSLGGYAQINLTDTISIVGGAQNANNITGDKILFNHVGEGPWAWFLYAQWTPKFSFLPASQSSQYSLLYYEQPAVSLQPFSSQGWSFNAVQNLDANWGLFARANHSTGSISQIKTSLAAGVVYNNPFGLHLKDQIGIGIAQNYTNQSLLSAPARNSETVAEAYYNRTFFNLFQVGANVQVIFNPALQPGSGTVGVFTLRIAGLI